MDDVTLIDRHGGPSKLAEKLGFPKAGGTQRVFNWIKRRRIPSDVKLDRQDLFGAAAVREFEYAANDAPDTTPGALDEPAQAVGG